MSIEKQEKYKSRLEKLQSELNDFDNCGTTNEKILDMLPMTKTDYINKLKDCL